jgi:nicotinamide mononucleotide transporter
MARGWVEFWLVWMLVDIVGVRSLIQAGYYPTAGMYVFYAVFVVIGFFVWWRASRTAVGAPAAESQETISA